MRVVLITGGDLEHRYVARRLSATATGLVAIVTVTPEPLARRKRVVQLLRRYGWQGAAARAATKAILRVTGEAERRRREISAILGEDAWPHGVPVLTVPGANHPTTVELLTELDVDLLCVYGTAIVRDGTLAAAHTMALNLHTGISPRYRGADCAFWPLHNGEPQYVGATVHVCTSAVDGGAVFETASARLSAIDGVGGVFARAVAAGAEAFGAVVDRVVAGEAVARPQDLSAGVEYRAAMRTGAAEWRTVRALRTGLVRDHAQAQDAATGVRP